MASCIICGDERATYRERSRMHLCAACHRDTPNKVDRAEFERVYWDGKASEVSAGIRQSFWEDYRASKYGRVMDYIEATTSWF